MEPTRALAKFCAEVSYDALPPDVIEKAKLCILDFIANVYGSHEIEAVRSVAEYIRSLGGPEHATALACDFNTGIHNAAFLNGTAAEAIEAQDGLRFGGNHPGVAVIPAALAVAELRGLSGRELIEAVVVGYEAADRPAAAVHPHHTLSGFLPTGTCGAFGAAAAASKLMNHDAGRMLHSLSIAGFLLPISMAEHLMGGFTAKILQGGQAAGAGLTAAGLADSGIQGTPFVLEGSHLKGGFTQITSRSAPAVDRITDGLGERFTISDIYLKPFTSCRHTHGAAQAAAELRASENFSPDAIDSITVHTYGIATIAVGKTISPGDSFVSAQFSLPYVTAATLVDGAMGPEQLQPDRMSDPVILDLMRRVKVTAAPDLNAVYPGKTSSRLEVRLSDGRVLTSQTDIPKGDPRDPMSAADVAEKLKRFARRKKSDTSHIADAVMNLERIPDVRQLTILV